MNYETGPILRGLTFNGKTCGFALYGGPGLSATLTVPNSRPETLIRAFRKFTGENGGAFPGAVSVEGSGTWYLGAHLDDALEKCGASDPGLPWKHEPGKNQPPIPVAFVTGGAQGFGEEIVRGLAEAGAVVAIADLNEIRGAELADELNEKLGRAAAFMVKVDVSDEESVAAAFNMTVRKTGGIDLCVSNAGVLKAGSVLELPLQDFEFVTAVNYTAFFTVTRYTARIMKLQHDTEPACRGDIIQINSKSGLEGSNKNGAYAGGKFGGIGLVQSFALELVEHGIKVNAVCPGNFFDGPLWSDPDRGLFVQYLNTGKVPGAQTIADVKAFYESKVPMKRGCTGEDVMKAIFYLVEQQYETGQALPVTGGQVMLH